MSPIAAARSAVVLAMLVEIQVNASPSKNIVIDTGADIDWEVQEGRGRRTHDR